MKNPESSFRRLDATGVPLLVVRLVVGGLFVWMGIQKIKDPVEFLKLIHIYDMMPESPAFFLNGTAIILPWIEVLVGLALLAGLFVRGAAATSILMLAVFTPAVLIRALAIRAADGTPFFQIAFDCGCGSGVIYTWKKLLENSMLFILSVYGLISMSRRFCLSHWLDRRRAHPELCQHCGYSLKGAPADLCGPCQTRGGLGQPAADAV